jgi:hypothetical protein
MVESDEVATVRRICLCLTQAIVGGLRKLGLSAVGEMSGSFVVITIDGVEVACVDGSWVFGPRESAQRFRATVKSLTAQVLDAVQTSMRAQGDLDWPCAPGGPSLVPFAHDSGQALIGYFGPDSHDDFTEWTPGLRIVIVDLDWQQLVLQSQP